MTHTAPEEGSQVYRPPTYYPQTPLVLYPSPTSIPTDALLLPLSTPSCINGLTFLEDLTVPDGTQVASGGIIDKQWSVENTGECNWNQDYRLRLVAGSEMGAPLEQAIYPARAGNQAIIRMVFTAPSSPGLYRSAWQAYDPQGVPFGDTIFIEIIVVNP